MTHYTHTATRQVLNYPFSMIMSQSNPGPNLENKLLYNNKELQDDVVTDGKKLKSLID